MTKETAMWEEQERLDAMSWITNIQLAKLDYQEALTDFDIDQEELQELADTYELKIVPCTKFTEEEINELASKFDEQKISQHLITSDEAVRAFIKENSQQLLYKPSEPPSTEVTEEEINTEFIKQNDSTLSEVEQELYLKNRSARRKNDRRNTITLILPAMLIIFALFTVILTLCYITDTEPNTVAAIIWGNVSSAAVILSAVLFIAGRFTKEIPLIKNVPQEAERELSSRSGYEEEKKKIYERLQTAKRKEYEEWSQKESALRHEWDKNIEQLPYRLWAGIVVFNSSLIRVFRTRNALNEITQGFPPKFLDDESLEHMFSSLENMYAYSIREAVRIIIEDKRRQLEDDRRQQAEESMKERNTELQNKLTSLENKLQEQVIQNNDINNNVKKSNNILSALTLLTLTRR